MQVDTSVNDLGTENETRSISNPPPRHKPVDLRKSNYTDTKNEPEIRIPSRDRVPSAHSSERDMNPKDQY